MSSQEKETDQGSTGSQPAGTSVPRLGFVVLHVADLAASAAFYGQALGLPVRIRRRGFIEFATPGANLALQQAGAEAAGAGSGAGGGGGAGAGGVDAAGAGDGGEARGAGDGATRGGDTAGGTATGADSGDAAGAGGGEAAGSGSSATAGAGSREGEGAGTGATGRTEDGATRGAEVVLVVDDVRRAAAGLAARGIALEGTPENQPWEGGVRTALVRDPDGNAVRLLQMLRSAQGCGSGGSAEDGGSAAGRGLAHVRVVAGSVVEAEADAIVNAANTDLRHGGGVAAAIARAAGPELERASREAAPCPLGSAVATPAGRLRASRVIHVPTVDYRAGRSATPAEITAGTAAALDICRREGLRRVAFPLLGAGIAGTSPRQALLAMVAAFAAHPDLEIAVHAFSAADRRAAAEVLGDGGGG